MPLRAVLDEDLRVAVLQPLTRCRLHRFPTQAHALNLTPLDAETKEFNGPGIRQARIDIAGYKDNRFELEAGENAVFDLWNRGEVALIEGFTLGWKPDAAKDPAGKARMILKVR